MKNTRNGFTLIEVTISAAISTIIIFGAFTILQVNNSQIQVIQAKMSLEEGPREAIFKMAQEIRQTAWHKIDTLAPPDTNGIESASIINFVVPVPSPDAASLVDANFTPKWASGIQYKLDTNTHQILRISTDLTTNAQKQAVLANEVTSLGFSRETSVPGLITITVAAQRTLPDGRKVPDQPVQMTTQAEARNP